MAEKKKKKGKKQINSKRKKENIILRNLLIVIGVIFFAIAVFVIISYFNTNFEYEGVKFRVVKEEGVIFYETNLPVVYRGEKKDYAFYLRNDPRKLKDVPFEGEIGLLPILVINSTSDFNCDGDGIISTQNFVNLYTLLGTKVMKDENASCDSEGQQYMFIKFQESNESEIKQYGPACYEFNINNCEILKVTEKFMLETFSKINELL